MDREELEERLRTRRPGDVALRRGGVGRGQHEPFEPEPEDNLAVRPDEPSEAPVRRVDDTPEGFDEPIPAPPPAFEPSWRSAERAAAEPVVTPGAGTFGPAVAEPEQRRRESGPEEPRYGEPPYMEPPYVEPGMAEPSYYPGWEQPGEPAEDPYAYPYLTARQRHRGGGSALPIIGFIVLSVMALAVGVMLSGLLTNPGAAESSPTPLASASGVATTSPSVEPSQRVGSATPEPTDGPIAFPDGALLSIQPCGSDDFNDKAVGDPEEEACETDGSSVKGSEAWAFIVFKLASGSDTLTVDLRIGDETVNEQELVLGSVLTECGTSCSGLVYGAHYVDLPDGEYQLVLERNGDFADSATFTVEG
jgi:hypothetical protein